MSLWIIIVAISLIWNYQHVKHSVFELARIQAQSTFDKDILYRRWNASHGGVYVPPENNTPPNPYLTNLNKRDVMTTSGKRLTLINPAYMTRQVHELGVKAGGVQGHITSLNPIRPENAPDCWERTALLSFEQGADEKVELVEKDNRTYLRYMRPLITEKACLNCHEVQGYQIGDVRGGISVSVPFEPFIKILRRQQEGVLFGHGAIGLLGFMGLWGGGRRLCHSQRHLTASLQETRQLAAKNQLLLTSLGVGVYGTNSEGKCSFINPAALKMLGYTQEEVIGQDPHSLFHAHRINGEAFPSETCPVFKTLKDGKHRETEDAFICRDGQILQVSLIVTAIQDPDDTENLGGVITSFRDITERKQIENALQETKNHLGIVVSTIPDLIWLKDTNGVYLACNREFELFFGATEQEILGKTDYDFVPVDLADFFRKKDQEAMIAGYVNINEEEVVYKSDGRRVTLETRKVPILNINGDIRGILGIGRDITERKNAEKTIMTANKKLQEMAMQDGLTQVANRRCFDMKLAEEWRRMMRDKMVLSVILFDVDYFKSYNDRYGHQAGDVCLQAIANRARTCLKRPGDLFARYGGEEFVAVLPNSDNTGAMTLAEQMRHQIYELEIPHDASQIRKYVTVSCGVASVVPTKSTTPQMLLETADKALYEAKKTGRNRVIARQL